MSTEQKIIEAGKTEKQYLKDLWSYRELFIFLAWRDFLVRYRQTAFGVLWAILRPFLTMVVFSVIFGKIASLPSNGVPYPILVYSAMLPWYFFAQAFQDSSNSLVAGQNMMAKIYFPRIIMPVSAVIVALVDFAISFLILIGLMIYFQYPPQWTIIFLPFFLMIAFVAAMGAGIFVAALNVKYRDFRYIVPFIIQIGLYISPVGFSSLVIPEKWRIFYSLNPLVGVIEGFRWSILGGINTLNLSSLVFSVLVTSALIVIGVYYFRRTERKFVDII
jgi:lipopolysaccharide transport system permease protein